MTLNIHPARARRAAPRRKRRPERDGEGEILGRRAEAWADFGGTLARSFLARATANDEFEGGALSPDGGIPPWSRRE